MNLESYLENSEVIDWQHPIVLNKARELAQDCESKEELAKRCFEFVRDAINHSWDYQQNPVTCKASDVLQHGTGYCYAKSHLLAALLRANGIPAGLCYQRFRSSSDNTKYLLHGLNAIYLESYGWYRVDPRGNKPGVTAEFCPPKEKLAFPNLEPGEETLPEIWVEPLPQVVRALTQYHTYQEVSDNLPDLET